jgi:hypothetical protein
MEILMFTNEFEFDETITTILDDSGEHEDVQLSIGDNEVWIRQWCETLGRYELVCMSHKMFYEMQEALKKPAGMYYVELNLKA